MSGLTTQSIARSMYSAVSFALMFLPGLFAGLYAKLGSMFSPTKDSAFEDLHEIMSLLGFEDDEIHPLCARLNLSTAASLARSNEDAINGYLVKRNVNIRRRRQLIYAIQRFASFYEEQQVEQQDINGRSYTEDSYEMGSYTPVVQRELFLPPQVPYSQSIPSSLPSTEPRENP